jgi:Inorganic Pyrophosphatase
MKRVLYLALSPPFEDEDDDVQKASIDRAAHGAATSLRNDLAEPTARQKHAGNYPKGHLTIGGLSVSIENPAGSKRRPEWPTLRSHYGYIRLTRGADGEQVDCFVRVGTDESWSGPVFVVDQVKLDGSFDEHKVMIGWRSRQKAIAAYLVNFTLGWQLGEVTRLDWADFKAWVETGWQTEPVAE